jgi:hypothetical protein
MTDTEPTVRGSWPLVQLVEGIPHWHIEGTHPPQYAPDEALERVWREKKGRMQHTYIVNLSSGLGSAKALERAAEQAQKEGAHVVAVFADVRGMVASEHAGEDADNYRFLDDIEAYFTTTYPGLVTFVRIVEGRDIWQAMFDARAMTLPVGKSKVARCSIDLKRKPIDAWVQARYSPDECTLVAGMGWDEPHRMADFEAAKAPYRCWFPLADAPYLDKCDIEREWAERGITAPRLYEAGFSHANCGGFCVKAGQAHFANLYRWNKERYLYHAEKEAQFRREINDKAAILRDRRGGKTSPMTLHDFIERIESGDYDHDEFGGCGCFAPTAQERMAFVADVAPDMSIKRKGQPASTKPSVAFDGQRDMFEEPAHA